MAVMLGVRRKHSRYARADVFGLDNKFNLIGQCMNAHMQYPTQVGNMVTCSGLQTSQHEIHFRLCVLAYYAA